MLYSAHLTNTIVFDVAYAWSPDSYVLLSEGGERVNDVLLNGSWRNITEISTLIRYQL